MKPKVICHIMASVDGHIQVERWSDPADSMSKSEVLSVYSSIGQGLHTDAWTFGKNTLRSIFPDRTDVIFPKAGNDAANGGDVASGARSYKAERHSQRMFISFDPEADIVYTYSQLRGDDILAVLNAGVTTRYLDYLRSMNISYIVVPDIADMRSTLEAINETFGVKTISLQGGGVLDGAMLSAGVIDELSLVVYPGIDCSSDSVSVFDKVAGDTASKVSLQLIGVEQKSYGAVWMRYKIRNK